MSCKVKVTKKVDSYWKMSWGEAVPYKVVEVVNSDTQGLAYFIEFADDVGVQYWRVTAAIKNDIPSSEDEFLLYKID